MDYLDFSTADEKLKKEAQKSKSLPASNRWWKASDELLPAMIMAQVGSIIIADQGRIDGYNKYAKLYGTFTPAFWNGYALSNSGKSPTTSGDRLTYNISQSCTDALVSTVTINKPKPMFLTQAGSSRQQRKAKKLDAYCYGTFYQNKVYDLAPMTLRDSCIFGEGIIHPHVENGRMKYDRVFPYELLCDYLESHYGPRSTRSLFRIKNIDRTELAENWPEHAAQIAMMTGTNNFISAAQRSVGDTVTIIEAWRLPVGNDPGLHAIVGQNLILHKDKYTHDFFPFAIHRYCPRLYGFYSQSLVEQLVPTQVEINRTLISIQGSLYRGGTHKILVKAGSRVIKSHFDNLIGTIIEYAGDTPPQYIVPQLVQPEIYAHLNNMIGMGYQLPGISQMGATSVKTPGVDSGRAMRTEQNIATQRHNTVDQRYQQLFVDLAQITVSVARDHYKCGGSLEKVNVPGKRFIESIDWKDCDLEDDQFILQIYPVSKLPQEPEGRIATVTEMMQSGLIDPQVGRRILDFPDLEAEENLANASQDYLHKILDDIVDSGKYTGPDPDDNLEMAKRLCLEYLAQAKLNNTAPERIQQLRTFNMQIETHLKNAAAAANPQPQPGQDPQGQALGVPLPPPTGELLPNVNSASPVQ